MVVDPNVYSGPPAEARHPNEMAVYAFLDQLGISYQRCDHEYANTMEDCKAVEAVLGAPICKNLLLTPAKTQGAGILNLAHTGQAYTVFMELLPVFHVFSALGSEALGINCDLPKFDDFYGVMDTKL